MATQEECESMGMDYVPGYKKRDGSYVSGFCRARKQNMNGNVINRDDYDSDE